MIDLPKLIIYTNTMDLNDKRDYELMFLSTRICRHCIKFQTYDCPKAPEPGDKYNCHPWSSMSACDEWTPDEQADEALQILTMRKLDGTSDTREKTERGLDFGE